MKDYQFPVPDGGDQSQGWALLAVCWSFLLAALATTVLRFYVRAKLTRNLGADDWTILAATVTTLVGAGLITAETLNGLGRHQYYLTATQRRDFVKYGWVDWMQTFITLMFMKISICLFILRLINSRAVQYFMYSLIFCLVTNTVINVGLFLGICRPLYAYWRAGVEGVCFTTRQIEWIIICQGIFSAITDIICAGFPVWFLRNLQVSFRTKLALCSLMGLGIITAICCIVRTALAGGITHTDQTWTTAANLAWRLPEVNIGIVCANAPMIRPLYLYFRGRLQTRSSMSGRSSKSPLWPGSSGRRSGKLLGRHEKTPTSTGGKISWPSYGNKKSAFSSDAAATEETSVEMGLPIQGGGDIESQKRHTANTLYLNLDDMDGKGLDRSETDESPKYGGVYIG